MANELPIDQTGNPAPAALIADPYFASLVRASQVPNGVSLSSGFFNPLDSFRDTASPDTGAAVIVLNSLSTPLTLVHTWGNGLTQVCYPVIIDPGTPDNSNKTGFKIVKTHTIPAARPYPKASLHPRPQGGPLQMGGVGIYRFSHDLWAPWHARGLAFASTKDGSDNGALIALAFRLDVEMNIAVTADLASMHGSDVGDNFNRLYNQRRDWGPIYNTSPAPASVTVWACRSTTAAKAESPYTVMTLWVRDIASTVG